MVVLQGRDVIVADGQLRAGVDLVPGVGEQRDPQGPALTCGWGQWCRGTRAGVEAGGDGAAGGDPTLLLPELTPLGSPGSQLPL